MLDKRGEITGLSGRTLIVNGGYTSEYWMRLREEKEGTIFRRDCVET